MSSSEPPLNQLLSTLLSTAVPAALPTQAPATIFIPSQGTVLQAMAPLPVRPSGPVQSSLTALAPAPQRPPPPPIPGSVRCSGCSKVPTLSPAALRPHVASRSVNIVQMTPLHMPIIIFLDPAERPDSIPEERVIAALLLHCLFDRISARRQEPQLLPVSQVRHTQPQVSVLMESEFEYLKKSIYLFIYFICVSSQGYQSAPGHDHHSNRQQQLHTFLRTVLSIHLQTQEQTAQ